MILQFTGYSIITGIFSDELLKYIGYIEIVVGLGLGLGPMVGGLVFPFLHYEGTMFFFGFLNLGAMALCYFMLPAKLNKAGKYDQPLQKDPEQNSLVKDDGKVSKYD